VTKWSGANAGMDRNYTVGSGPSTSQKFGFPLFLHVCTVVDRYGPRTSITIGHPNAMHCAYVVHMKPLNFCAMKDQTLFRRTCGIKVSQIWTQSITRSGLSCNILSTRQKSVAWMNGGWSTFGVALNSRLSTWLLTASVEDFEHLKKRTIRTQLVNWRY